ncbi:winged helix-turn-helix transcriptional regulator [Patescibacteria group bacterium]|nr:winged helix-turn-helix transcriptional regulator [Patescibacteria group bacterium]MBP9710375.1 winged helix-turn-helix transcriptional regulator [Patescibacteria group bacterium]
MSSPLRPGLNETGTKIWNALAHKSPLSIVELASLTEKTRPTIYKYLDRLQKDEFVLAVKKEKRIVYALNKAKHPLDRPRKGERHPKSDPDVLVYRGKDIRKVWERLLEELPKKAIFYRYDGYGSSQSLAGIMPANNYQIIEDKKLERFVITNDVLRRGAYKKRVECASRKLPVSFDRFEQGITQFIFGDTIALVDLTKQVAFMIENKALAEYHRKLFQFIYRQLPE